MASPADQAKCPVDHTSSSKWANMAAPHPVPPQSSTDQPASCPVDHGDHGSSKWASMAAAPHPMPPQTSGGLSTNRVTSSIPTASEGKGNWVYPSEAQFFAAMARKNHNPQAADMKTIVPIHNAVNEQAWSEILKWEAGRGAECGGPRLVNFQGKPQQRTPRARWNMLLGYSAPFDRHDWVVDRCGVRTRYVIDFYTGRTGGASNNVSFYLDVRPALDDWNGVQMRVGKFFSDLFGSGSSPSSKSTSS